MAPLVTIALPVYRRLDYVPQAIESVRAQDYPNVELLLSDNGPNGDQLPAMAAKHYGRPHTFRRNQVSASFAVHWNQLIAAASGDYFVLLSDDDELSPNFVSSLLPLLERDGDVAAAIGQVETIDESGRRIARTDDGPLPPERMAGQALVRAWSSHAYKFLCFTTILARTAELRALGGYPDFPSGNGVDNALLVKLAVGRSVAFAPGCTMRHRVYDTSFGKAASISTLAEDSRRFLRLLREDPHLRAYARAEPETWARVREDVAHMIRHTYLSRWKGMYRRRMGRAAWARAAFELPWDRGYYAGVLATLAASLPGWELALQGRRRFQAAGRRLAGE
jgi:glycosyltransferase involved in cell wall biosynthesis